MQPAKGRSAWWGEYDLEVDETVQWTIGPLDLWLRRGHAEWRLSHEREQDGAQDDWAFVRSAPPPQDSVQTQRFALSSTSPKVVLAPRAADRPVVVRPNNPFRVLPGQRTRIFISSPLWVEIAVGEGPTILAELPTKRLSDTWLGASTREGELCYALKTSARTDLAEMPHAAYRLLTPVVIENRASEALLVERVSLPVPFLSVYGRVAGEAWSEEVAMLNSAGGELTELEVHEGPPAEADDSEAIGRPRQTADRGHLFRAFGSLLDVLDLGG